MPIVLEMEMAMDLNINFGILCHLHVKVYLYNQSYGPLAKHKHKYNFYTSMTLRTFKNLNKPLNWTCQAYLYTNRQQKFLDNTEMEIRL